MRCTANYLIVDIKYSLSLKSVVKLEGDLKGSTGIMMWEEHRQVRDYGAQVTGIRD